MSVDQEIEALRRDVQELQAKALTPEQKAAVAKLAEHVERIIAIVEADKMQTWLMGAIRSWSVAVAAVIAAFWVVRDGAARLLKNLLSQ